MGNRAVITASKATDVAKATDIGIYLHWNGGRDSVEAFLEYCKLKGFRSPDKDSYGWARLCQVIGNYFGGSNSIGIDQCCHLDCDNWDNGVYIIEGWEIVGRQYYNGREQSGYDRTEMLIEIDSCQPEYEQLGEDFIKAPVVKREEIKVGDKVFYPSYNDKWQIFTCVGIGKDEIINGTNVKGIPYISKFGISNINSYLLADEYRIFLGDE